MRSTWAAIAGALASMLVAACAPTAAAPGEARVWTSANSNDGFATCPYNTAVTGGGFEIKDERRKSEDAKCSGGENSTFQTRRGLLVQNFFW